ncbi:hypothetical protein MPH_07117 [Macrophomina phaseolina MS6]|uniref:ceramidase n=1 Tax=Macrophomina phaseolina (strain MS6) TaxID=1126212 RepID=K2RSI3_MACPH|nr:hypothetical protein MPH_07117 [Macrophomina phaseolina MS6]
MYLLVCFNTLLDSFMGCTSGGARVKTEGGTRMYHFRTLDWAMDILRHVVVELEFVNKPHGHVIARSVAYVGFVGVLTGVRKDLSISLNFRPCHNDPGSLSAALKLCYHQLAVLLGRRPSIVSHLRDMLIPRHLHDSRRRHEPTVPTLESIRRTFPSVKTSAAYLIFSDGDETTVLEKDRITAVERSSNAFVAATNCDAFREGLGARQGAFGLNLMGQVLDEADDRLEVLEQRWRKVEERFRRRKSTVPHEEIYGTVKDVEEMVEIYPITNESTHYSLIMDPKAGEILRLKRYALGAI